MAVIVRSELDLPTIRILLGRTPRHRFEAVFQTVRGGGKPIEVDRCPTEELGLPDTITKTWLANDGVFRLPDRVGQTLQQAVDALGYASIPPENAVWLELPSPRGHLYLVPWERLLASLGRPLMRLPNHTLRPQAAGNSLEIALCASAPMAKTAFDTAYQLERLTRLGVQHAGHQVHVHLFTDISGYQTIIDHTTDLGPAVVVHDPREADQYSAPRRTSRVGDSSVMTNPWLLWVRDSLHGRALDVIHFVTHGYLSGDRGAIALASTPTRNTDPSLSRFVGAAELATLLGQVGAWGLVLTGPPYNYSGAGLRELADAIALSRPGVTLIDELTIDTDGGQFGQMVEMVFGGGSSVTQPVPGVTCWVHPSFVDYPLEEQDKLLLTEDGRSSLIKAATQTVLTHDHTPSWVAASTRYLETQQVGWLPERFEEDVDPDAVAALKSVSSLLEKHASRYLSTEGDETP